MKNLVSYLTIFILIVTVSCKKDDDDDSIPEYSVDELVGKWKQVSPVPEDEECTVYEKYMEFTTTTIKDITSCEGIESYLEADYVLDKNKITYNMIFDIELTITQLTETSLTFNIKIVGLGNHGEYSYERVE